jgi:hypothetical protein
MVLGPSEHHEMKVDHPSAKAYADRSSAGSIG